MLSRKLGEEKVPGQGPSASDATGRSIRMSLENAP